MFSEEETELRDLIIQNLENCGFLSKIKAELRAGVFLAIEEDGNLKNKIPLFNKKFDSFAATTEGMLMLSLVRDFLEYFNLHFTLSVFDPEIAINSPCMSREEIRNQLNINSEIDGPVISVLIKDKLKDNHLKCSTKFLEELKSDDKSSLKSVPESVLEESNHTLKENNNIGEKNLGSAESENKANSSESDKKEFEHTPDNRTFTDYSNPEKVTNAEKISIFKTTTDDILSPDHDPFFDEPLPAENTTLFNFSETFKDKSDSKLTPDPQNNVAESKIGGLSSLKDLPSLATNSEWTFSRDAKSTFPSLDSQKSVSSSETSNEEIVNLDPKESFKKKDSDIAESNEDSSEKPNSEESIEEEIEEDFSAGFEDLLNSSLSLADDVTTDQTVSQTSVVEGVDHVEPCK